MYTKIQPIAVYQTKYVDEENVGIFVSRSRSLNLKNLIRHPFLS